MAEDLLCLRRQRPGTCALSGRFGARHGGGLSGGLGGFTTCAVQVVDVRGWGMEIPKILIDIDRPFLLMSGILRVPEILGHT